MKRFFCTECKKIKHVRVLPRGVVTDIQNPKMRTGICRWHNRGESITRSSIIGRERVRTENTKKTPAPQANTKKKK